MPEKKLYRDSKDRLIAGVLGGLGKYMAIDANVIRIIYVIITIATGFFPGIILYAACCLILPLAPEAPKDETIVIEQTHDDVQ